MDIDWTTVNWLYFGLLLAIVFVASLIGHLLSFRRSFLGAFITTVLFAAAFIGWTYYPHHLPLPNNPMQVAAPPPGPAPAAAPSAAPAPPAKPANPIREVEPR
jgi:hypothetical protein